MNLLELTDKELKMLSYELNELIKTDIEFSTDFLLLVRKIDIILEKKTRRIIKIIRDSVLTL